MKKINFEDSRKLQFGLLKEIDRFCTANGIRYFMAFGTLLGAVRHKGYIPWDDDTDVCMPRPDYERFMKEYMNNDTYSVYTFHSDKNYFYTFGRIRDNRQGNKKLAGVCVDIYPIEGLPQNENELSDHVLNVEKIRKKEMVLTRWYSRFNRYHLSFFNIILRPLIYKNACKMENVIMKYDYESSKNVSALSTIVKNVIPKDYYGKGIKLEFENELFMAPNKTIEWLTNVYGDFMKLPPVEKRTPNHWGNFYYY